MCKGPEVGMAQAGVTSRMKGGMLEHKEPRGEEPRMRGTRQRPGLGRLLDQGRSLHSMQIAALGSWFSKGGKQCWRGEERSPRGTRTPQELGCKYIVQWSFEPT